MRLTIGAALIGTFLATAPITLRAEDHPHVYHDRKYNADHEWNDHEDRAYKMYLQEQHRKYKDFAKLKEGDRDKYWAWRHEHNDAILKLDIR